MALCGPLNVPLIVQFAKTCSTEMPVAQGMLGWGGWRGRWTHCQVT